MALLFIVVCFIVAVLILFMFMILKKAVRTVNEQTKSYFVNKLQGYDELITARENKLNEIDEQIKNKENLKEENKKIVLGSNYAFDTNVIDLFNTTKYQDSNIFELNKRIDSSFVVNYEELVKDFLKLCSNDGNYSFCLKLRNKFDSQTIYNLKCVMENDLDNEIRKMLNEKELKVYEAFKLIFGEDTIENFIVYLDQLVDLNSPKVTILVGNTKENYDHLSKNIETKYNEKIYRGLKIIYRNKVYDFSLCERNI